MEQIDDALGDEVRVTVIATGFDHGRGRGYTSGGYQAPATPRYGRNPEPPSRDRPSIPRDRSPRIDDRQRSSLEIGDDEIDIPPFLRDR